ncbi:MAG: cyclase family protein, partial [Acidobacteria bacterium]|nr:cyclase family protein [Acidobacteriota bacterium]
YGGLSEFYIASLHCCGNTGTYVDAPIHRYRGGTDLAGLSLDRLAHVPLLVVDALDLLSIGPDLFRGLKMSGRAVVVRTEWSRHWRTDAYFGENPHLTEDACQALLDGGAVFAGIDSVNIDALADLRRPAHTTLLAAGVPICEHMTNLSALPKEGGYLHAAPIAWVGGATFPVRAYVLTD